MLSDRKLDGKKPDHSVCPFCHPMNKATDFGERFIPLICTLSQDWGIRCVVSYQAWYMNKFRDHIKFTNWVSAYNPFSLEWLTSAQLKDIASDELKKRVSGKRDAPMVGLQNGKTGEYIHSVSKTKFWQQRRAALLA
jgi:hypothetical protein